MEEIEAADRGEGSLWAPWLCPLEFVESAVGLEVTVTEPSGKDRPIGGSPYTVRVRRECLGRYVQLKSG